MDKRWHWTRLGGWLEVGDWRDIISGDGPPPPEGSLLLVKPADMAFIAVAPMPWRPGLKPRQLVEMTAVNMRGKGMLLGPVEEADDGSSGIIWTSADGLNSGRMLVRVAPEEPSTILVINSIWSSDQDWLNAEFDVIAATVHRDD